MRVHVADPNSMSLPGLLAAGLLARRLPARTRLHGDIALDIGGAAITLRFRDDEVEVTRAPAVAPLARVHGSYAGLSALAAGRAWEAVRQGVRAHGSPRALLVLATMLLPERAR